MESIVSKLEKYIDKYATLADNCYRLPLALWIMGTHTWPTFDAFPYLVITAGVAQAGKTRLMEIAAFVASNSETFSPDSPASMFRALMETKPTMWLDEAEKFNVENHPARELLNKGYRKGNFITRIVNGRPFPFETYCPKAFVLIGDVYATLRDRSIAVMMRRRTPTESANSPLFRMATAKIEGEAMRVEVHGLVEQSQQDIESAYLSGIRLPFLNDRDEEIFQPLFALAQVFCPERIEELSACAVDISTEKQAKARKESKEAKEQADFDYNKILLLRDMLTLTEGKKAIPTSILLRELKALPTAPWRKYKGEGLTDIEMGRMLDSLKVNPRPLRVKSGKATEKAILRGYLREELERAAVSAGLERNTVTPEAK